MKTLLVLLTFSFTIWGQTTQIRPTDILPDQSATTTQIYAAISTPQGVKFGNLLIDTSTLFLDTTTTPWTLKVIQQAAQTPITFVDEEIPTGVVNGTNNVFTLAFIPINNSLKLYRNGLRMKRNLDYVITSGTNTIGFLTGATPKTGDILLADYRR